MLVFPENDVVASHSPYQKGAFIYCRRDLIAFRLRSFARLFLLRLMKAIHFGDVAEATETGCLSRLLPVDIILLYLQEQVRWTRGLCETESP